jgi:hypothetical protein
MRYCVRCSPISRSTSSPEVGSYLKFLISLGNEQFRLRQKSVQFFCRWRQDG